MLLNTEMIPYVLSQMEIAKDDLEGCRCLIDNDKHRIALNRSYYCVFHCLKALCVLYDQNFSKHSGYISYFQREFIKPGILPKELSKVVTKTKRLRESSDYGDMMSVDKATAEDAYMSAEVLYNALYEYINTKITEL